MGCFLMSFSEYSSRMPGCGFSREAWNCTVEAREDFTELVAACSSRGSTGSGDIPAKTTLPGGYKGS